MRYELINPSDPYTFVAESRETAALTVFVLGAAYGGKPECGDENIPVFIFGGAGEWYGETFGRTPGEGMAALENEVADSLESLVLGNFGDRQRYEAALAAIDDPEKKEAFTATWRDGRTSLNDIGEYAHRTAKAIRAKKRNAEEDKNGEKRF